MSKNTIVVVDTCVLISNTLRFITLSLARKGYFHPVWSAIIRDEWLRNASRLWHVERDTLALDWQQWDTDFPFANQGEMADLQPWKSGLQYSDPKDWHVIAAARAAQSHFPEHKVLILTRNIKDFNRSELARLGMTRIAPDAFFCTFLSHAAEDVNRILTQLPQAVCSPDKPAIPLTDLLKRERLFTFNKNRCKI